MSMNFREPISDEAIERMKAMFDVAHNDKKTFLLRDSSINQKQCSDIAKMTGQISQLELNQRGDIKELSDGRKFMLKAEGWKKL